MLEQLIANTEAYIQASSWLAFVAAFIGGLLTASNPCVLAMIPLMMAFVAGRREPGSNVLRALAFSSLFVFGLAITFSALGLLAALAGSIYGDVSSLWNWLIFAVCLVMGLHLAGVLRFTIPTPLQVQPKRRGALGAFLLGLLFGVVSAPCAAPILVVLLTYVAGANASLGYGALLLLLYALGHSVLILIAGTSMGAARALIESKRLTRTTEILRRAAGVVVVGVGLFFAYKGLQ